MNFVELRPDLVSVRDSMGKAPLHLNVESGNVWNRSMDALLSAYPEALDSKDDEGKILLVSGAVRHAHIAGSKSKDRSETSK